MAGLALASHSAFPSQIAVAWALLGGLFGRRRAGPFSTARSSSGRMGLNRAVAAVLGAAIPTVFGMFREGLRRRRRSSVSCWPRRESGSSPAAKTTALPKALAWLRSRALARGILSLHEASRRRFGLLVSCHVEGCIVHSHRHDRFDRTNPSQYRRLGYRVRRTRWLPRRHWQRLFIRASQTGRLDAAVVLSSLYPAVTVLLARFILREHFTPWKALGMVAALLAVPMIAWR